MVAVFFPLRWPPQTVSQGIEWGIRVAILLTPVVLLLLPADFFDQGPVLCPSRLLLEVDCPGCGLTRATQHLLHAEWRTAVEYNPLVLLTTPVLAWLWGKNLLVLYRSCWFHRRQTT
jgi:hypothetical protein